MAECRAESINGNIMLLIVMYQAQTLAGHPCGVLGVFGIVGKDALAFDQRL